MPFSKWNNSSVKPVIRNIAGGNLGKIIKNGVLVSADMITKNPNIQNLFKRSHVTERKATFRNKIVPPSSTRPTLPLCFPLSTIHTPNFDTTTQGLPVIQANTLFISRNWGH